MPSPSSELNPFIGLSSESIATLRKAGWIPGKNRFPQKLRRFPMKTRSRPPWYSFQRSRFPLDDVEWLEFVRQFFVGQLNDHELMQRTAAPRQIISELVGVVAKSHQGIPTTIIFDPTLALDDEELVIQAGELLGEQLTPLGELASQAFLVIAESGRVFLICFVEPGILYAGESFACAMNELLGGRRIRPVIFHSFRDPEGSFTFPSVSLYGSFVYDLESNR